MTKTDTSLYLLHALQFIKTIFAVKIFVPFSPFSCPWPSSVRLNYNKTLCIPAPTNIIHYTGDFFTVLLSVAEYS